MNDCKSQPPRSAQSEIDKRWAELAEVLESDRTQVGQFLRCHLSDLKATIDNDLLHGTLLAVINRSTRKKCSWEALAGVTVKCNCVWVHFTYVKQDFDRSINLIDLLKQVAELGRPLHYGYVIVKLPVVKDKDDLDSLKWMYAYFSAAEKIVDEKLGSGFTVRSYSIKKSMFERLI